MNNSKKYADARLRTLKQVHVERYVMFAKRYNPFRVVKLVICSVDDNGLRLLKREVNAKQWKAVLAVVSITIINKLLNIIKFNTDEECVFIVET